MVPLVWDLYAAPCHHRSNTPKFHFQLYFLAVCSLAMTLRAEVTVPLAEILNLSIHIPASKDQNE